MRSSPSSSNESGRRIACALVKEDDGIVAQENTERRGKTEARAQEKVWEEMTLAV